jgi:DNA primase
MSDIIKVLTYYGADCGYAEGNGWTKINCPFHADSVASGCVLSNEDHGGFICFGCGRKGDAIALIMEEEDLSFVGSKQRYQEIVGEEYSSVSGTTPGEPGGNLFEGKRAYERNAGLFPDWFRE